MARASSSLRKRKGKQRARDEGPGGGAGIVLPLNVEGSGLYDIVYTLSLNIGADNAQKLSLQVDTGSSDMWIASKSCSTSSCSQTKGSVYDPSKATQTNQTFNIKYLQGTVSGPIVWDEVELGGYSIANQAFAAADNVQDEPLTPTFSGILGLALPMNSIIASLIQPGTSNSPDGATLISNLFGLTPVGTAPSVRFLSLCLARPGSDRIPSYLGIGRHPSKVAPDPSKVQYSALVGDADGALFWKTTVRSLTVWINGEARMVDLGRSNTGGAFQEAVLDSGVPLILTTSAVANAIYGALGIGPASDGQYYVPCTTPLNISITLDNRSPIPLHPLDLTAEPPQGASSKSCIGLIQTADTQLKTPNSPMGDIVLGVPFLRNTYTVMAYDPPDDKGNLASPANRTDDGAVTIADIRPRLGLLPLTDPTTALDDFHRVRVLNQPLDPQPSRGAVEGGKKLSVGVAVLIGLMSFFGFCFLLFALRWFLGKRGWIGDGKTSGDGVRDVGDSGDKKGRRFFGMGGYTLARTKSQEDGNKEELSEDELRTRRYAEYVKKERVKSEYTMSSVQTKVEGGDDEVGMQHKRNASALSVVARNNTSSVSVLPPGAAAPAAPGLAVDLPDVQLEEWDPTTAVLPVPASATGGKPTSRQRYSSTGSAYEHPPHVLAAVSNKRSQRQRHSSTEQPAQAFEEFSAGGGDDEPSQQQRPLHLKHLSTDQPLEPYQDFSAGSGDKLQDVNSDLPFSPYRQSGYSPYSRSPSIVHHRTTSQLSNNRVTTPLLARTHSREDSQQSQPYVPSYPPPAPFPRTHSREESSPPQPYLPSFSPQEKKIDEFGTLVDLEGTSTEEGGGIMAGVGTAMRGSKIDPAWGNLTIGRDATGSPTFTLVDSPITMMESPAALSPTLPAKIPGSFNSRIRTGRPSTGSGGASSFERTA